MVRIGWGGYEREPKLKDPRYQEQAQSARPERVVGVVDRATNNVLGEFDSRAEAEGFLAELVMRDPAATHRVEIMPPSQRSPRQRGEDKS